MSTNSGMKWIRLVSEIAFPMPTGTQKRSIRRPKSVSAREKETYLLISVAHECFLSQLHLTICRNRWRSAHAVRGGCAIRREILKWRTNATKFEAGMRTFRADY